MMLTQTPRDQYIKIGDINTRYWASGDGETAVILLHGLGSCIESWTYNIGALSQQHRVYAIDLVGSGRSDKPPTSYSLVDLAKFVQAFMDALKLERVSLVGNSLGGGIALQFALLFPEQIEKLVLANSLGLGKEIMFFFRLASLPSPSQLFRPSRISTAFILKQIVYDSAVITDDWVEVLYQIGNLPGAPEALQRQLRANIDFWGVRPESYSPIVNQLTTINTPTLILWGQQDPVLPVAHAQFAAKHLPNADLQIFDNCGHWTQVERSHEFNAAILKFLLA
jgi:pimeloyl-ACP methyl ester carboxylesterase